MTDREKLVELLAKYFTIGDSYAYNLTRVKEAFAVGTVTIDDFVEFDDEVVADIADHLLANGVTVLEWIPVTERLPETDGHYLIYTTVYFTPDHCGDPDHYDAVEKSCYSTEFGFTGTHGLFAKAWMPLPAPLKQ